MFKRILFFALFLGACHAIFAQRLPNQDELQRFVSAYRVDDAIALIAKDSIYEVSQQAGPHRLYYTCVNRELTPELFKAVAADAIGEQISDAGVINQLSEFFESATGKTMRDYILSNLAKRATRRASGQATF